MDNNYNLLKGNNPLSLLLYYLFGIFLLVGAHHLSPTNLAGPGLDLPVFFAYFIMCIFFLIKTIRRLAKTARPYSKAFIINILLSLIINFVGAALFVIFNISPGDSW